MRLAPEIATEITTRARLVLKRQVNVADIRGQVLSGSLSGQQMADALRACQEGRVVRGTAHDDQVAWCPFVYEHQTIGAFGIVEEAVQVTPEAVSLLQGLAEVITHQYFLLEHVQPPEQVQARFIKQVLTTPTIDPTETHRQADILQINLRTPQAIILVEAAGFEEQATGGVTSSEERNNASYTQARVISEHLRGAFQHNPENLVCYLGNDVFMLSKGIGGDSLNTRNTARFLVEKGQYVHELLQRECQPLAITVGIGQYYPDLGGLRKSYQEAKLSLQVGSKVWGGNRSYHIKQVGMFVTLANIAQEHKAELAHQILYPLLKDEQLYKTVQTFLACGLNLTEASEKLHIHRNTLIYRLDKTKKVIGLDPRVFDDALQIKLGLMFYQESPTGLS
jgi:carbohydrate diacid regulator